jgi:dethiobiotin synthetase
MPSPDRLVAVVGTGTEVGKTWVTCAVAAQLRARNVSVAARKPAQSFAADDPADTRDAALLAAATGERPDDVCRPDRSYPVAMAPPIAAAALGRQPIRLAELLAELAWPAGVEVGFVETAGGIRSPIADDGDNADLVAALAPDVVLLVADAGLGTINLVRLTIDALLGQDVVVALNRFDERDDLHRRNLGWLADRNGLDVVTAVDDLVARVRG